MPPVFPGLFSRQQVSAKSSTETSDKDGNHPIGWQWILGLVAGSRSAEAVIRTRCSEDRGRRPLWCGRRSSGAFSQAGFENSRAGIVAFAGHMAPA